MKHVFGANITAGRQTSGFRAAITVKTGKSVGRKLSDVTLGFEEKLYGNRNGRPRCDISNGRVQPLSPVVSTSDFRERERGIRDNLRRRKNFRNGELVPWIGTPDTSQAKNRLNSDSPLSIHGNVVLLSDGTCNIAVEMYVILH